MFNVGRSLTISLVISTSWLNLQSSTAEILAHELRLAQSSVSISGRWDSVGLSTNNIITYRVFQKDGTVFGRYDLLDSNGRRIGGGQKWEANYKINSNGVIRIFNELKESCHLVTRNEMQCYSDGQSLGDLGYHKRR